MNLGEALASGAGRAVSTWGENGSCSVEKQRDGTYLIAATTMADRMTSYRYNGQRVADWDALVLRVAAFPFACDPVAGWSPAFLV